MIAYISDENPPVMPSHMCLEIIFSEKRFMANIT
jgi:hypothetical protein